MASIDLRKGLVFQVDTHLFRELGRLLVGRDSTALTELLKNSYDADAITVTVHGESLSDPMNGFIQISDDGVGMTYRDFRDGFLRIASRIKDKNNRRSTIYGRRYTGAKGIGRLAAHKLAAVLELESTPRVVAGSLSRGVKAKIDWDAIERHELLEQASDGLTVTEWPTKLQNGSGTTIRLRRLRRKWTDVQRENFVIEALAMQPPNILTQKLPRTLVSKSLLFDAPRTNCVRTKRDPGFGFSLTGDFAIGEDYWDMLAGAVAWVVEISADRQEIVVAVAPTKRTEERLSGAKRTTVRREPFIKSGLEFDARILVREGSIAQSLRRFVSKNSGVRVYMEGFRVLPYGEPKDDWLDILGHYARRTRGSLLGGETDGTDRIGLTALAQQNYHGAVFLTESSAAGLEMLVNREGFVNGEDYEALANSVKWGIDVFLRTRAAATLSSRERRRELRSTPSLPDAKEKAPTEFATAASIAELANEALEATSHARQRIALEGPTAALDATKDLERTLGSLFKAFAEEGSSDLEMLRILASVGTQLSTFVHEIRGLLGTIIAIEDALVRLRTTVRDRMCAQELRDIAHRVNDVRRNLERHTSYLADVVSLDARRRRSRQSISEAFDKSAAFLEGSAARNQIRIQSRIDPTLKTPPMFPAEVRTVFSNLLSNAIKAAGKNGMIVARSRLRADESVEIIVENTGRRVNVQKSERWFKPFESTSKDVDLTVGRGMGLGLPISRATLEQYDAEIGFISPSRGFATAIRIIFPK